MKTMMAVSVMLLAASAAEARTQLELYGDYRNVLATEHLDGDPKEAKSRAEKLRREVQPESPLYLSLASGATDQAELRYASGTQQQYYCKGKGLVYAEATHGDGSSSKLAFIGGTRKMLNDSYSQMGDGQWTYELANSFRKPQRSQLWMTDGQPNGFDIIEVRALEGGTADKGVFDFFWQGDSHVDRHWSVNGTDVEPTRLFMALQYHLWGSPDLGYKLDFVPGKQDHISWTFHGHSGEIVVKSEREVAEHLAHFSYQDGAGQAYPVDDCYRVEVMITTDKS